MAHRLTQIVADQERRYRQGDPILVEAYLAAHPTLVEDGESVVELLLREFHLREQLGESPTVAEYLRRFPEHRERLQRQFALQQLLQDALPSERQRETPRPEHLESLNLPPADPELSRPGEPPGPLQRSDWPSHRPPGRVRVALVAGSGPHATTEIQALLRTRLCQVTSLVSFAFLLAVAYTLSNALLWGERYHAHLWLEVWLAIGFELAVATSALGIAALLWSTRPLSLWQLRTWELIVFGLAVAFLTWNQWVAIQYWPPYVALSPDPVWRVMREAGATAGGWVLLIVSYGTFIPNTWRRCSLVVGAMGLAVMAVSALALATSAVSGALAGLFLRDTAFSIAIGAGIAILGCHRINVLHRAVLEARQLGQYQLKRRLGAGGMGEVYLAEHLLLRRPCAIKLIRPERVGDPTVLRRFEREVRTTATLTHPNTVHVFDYGHAEDGTFYCVMEYLPGLSLEQLVMSHGPLLPERVVHLLRQVCGALREAHAVGLIHRDIKPSNIITGERGGLHDVAKLLDFGLVQLQGVSLEDEKLTQEGTLTGTPAYMSPEQAAGTADLDARSDIYNLGAVAYFLLTGQPPFVRATAVQVLAAHIDEPPLPLNRLRDDIPADLQAVVVRCLEKDPRKRFQTIADLDQALAQCRCADQWTQQASAAWWQAHAGAA